jgi:hypothetical protein
MAVFSGWSFFFCGYLCRRFYLRRHFDDDMMMMVRVCLLAVFSGLRFMRRYLLWAIFNDFFLCFIRDILRYGAVSVLFFYCIGGL